MKQSKLVLALAVALCGVFTLLWLALDPAPSPVANSTGKHAQGRDEFRAFEGETAEIATAPAPPQGGIPQPSSTAQPSRRFDRQTLFGSRHEPDPATEAAFSQFNAWADAYLAAAPSDREAMLAEGRALAQWRRDQMEDLIQTDPKRALELRLDYSKRTALPGEWSELFEQPVSGRGDLRVLGVLAGEGQPAPAKPMIREAEVNGTRYAVFAFGWRAEEPTRSGVPISGVALGNLLALDENPARPIGLAEARALPGFVEDATCSITAQPSASFGTQAILEVEGSPVTLCSPIHAEQHNRSLLRAMAAGEAAYFDEEEEVWRATSAWTEGTKRLLVIRVDFSDLAGVPFSDQTGTNMVSGLTSFYRDSSYGKTTFAPLGQGSTLTATFRMPRTAADYGGNNDFNALRDDARNAARSSGLTLSNYELDLICFGAVPGFGWAGLGYVGAAGSWIRSSFDAGVPAHELGHNFGLNHANYWDTGGTSVIGAGSSVEYGDKFDTMGSAAAGQKHFNTRYKNLLNWLGSADVRAVTTNGIYTLNAMDVPTATGVRALRVTKNSQTNYWLEFRPNYSGNRWLASGVGLRWGRTGSQSSLLLDTTPGSLDDKDDSAITFGRTFSDPSPGVHITPLERLATTPPSVSVMINRGTFPGNQKPILSLASSATNIAVNGVVTLTATASDPDGDDIAYFWDYGDRNFGNNTPTTTYRWTATGYYLVRCTASDMKGQTTTASTVLRVGTPSTRVLMGQITVDGQPLEGVRVSLGSSHQGITEADGYYRVANIPNGSYTISAQLDGYTFLPIGFSNPLLVNANRLNLDFVGLASADQIRATLVPAGAVWSYLDTGVNLGTAWRAPTYNAATWKQGAAVLGYGDNDVTTILGFGPSSSQKYITTYFRHQFQVPNPADFTGLTLSVMRDDGAVVYLNGREIFRSNMPSGTVSSSTLATTAVGGTDEKTFYDADLKSSDLAAGLNTLAVEIHQAAVNSSDIGFDLRLVGFSPRSEAPPALDWTQQEGAIAVSWPASAVGWSLQYSDSIGEETSWNPVVGTPSVVSGRYVVTIPTTGESKFYLLRKP